MYKKTALNLPRILPLIVIFAALCSPAFAEYQVGDTVVVIHDTKIKVRDKVVQEVPRGVGLKVQAIHGDWLWVSNQAAGWISQRDVATPNQAIEEFTAQIKKNPHDADAFGKEQATLQSPQSVSVRMLRSQPLSGLPSQLLKPLLQLGVHT